MAVAVVICGAIAIRNSGKDPSAVKKWRTVGPRLSGAAWAECCQAAEIRRTCDEAVETREAAIALLAVAHGECLDKAFAAVEKYAKDDLSAAYFIRAQRTGDGVDFLRALDAASRSNSDAAQFNRALAQQKLGLTREAMQSWDDIVRRDKSAWANDARQRLGQLRATYPRWERDRMKNALGLRDSAQVDRITRAFPTEAMQYFELDAVHDSGAATILASALARIGDPYARDIVAAAANTPDPKAFAEGLVAFQQENYSRAADLLERAGNPLHLTARYRAASALFRGGGDCLTVIESWAPIVEKRRYRDLAIRYHLLRANALEQQDRYFEALRFYQEALALANSPKRKVDILSRRAFNYSTIGQPANAFNDAVTILSLTPNVADLNANHHTYASAARAARDLGFPAIALQFQNVAVQLIQKSIAEAPAEAMKNAKHHYAIALRQRADMHAELGNDAVAEADLALATELARAADSDYLPLLNMRLAEVRGQQAMAAGRFSEAAGRFTEAIALAQNQYSTYRANLYYKRALARQGDPKSDEDLALALKILQNEATRLRDSAARGDYEDLWKPYFSRFQAMHHQLIESKLAQNDAGGAFVHLEQSRGFEPIQLLLQAGPLPPGFQRIDSTGSLQQAMSTLPDDTLILQYLVLEDRTYSWALSRDNIRVSRHPVGRKVIQDWVARIRSGVELRLNGPITTVMRAVYEELFRAQLAGSTYRRIVIVPDGPMHGLPFSALESTSEGHLIRRSSVAIAGSTSLYLYALHRDREFQPSSRPRALIVGEPTLHPVLARQFRLGRIQNALAEAGQLHNDYPGSELLPGAEATTEAFLAAAKNATIIHFAGHAVANPHDPWLSMLMLAPQGKDAGDLTAEKLLKELPDLNARLIVLAACSTASGDAIGAEGLAPLVRPLIAARVPSVVGTLWNVQDTPTIRELLVSFHRHYRNGDDVAVALRKAQLEMLRDNRPARAWAAFQAVGYADSPYASRTAQKETYSELHRQDSLHRPDGLHSQ